MTELTKDRADAIGRIFSRFDLPAAPVSFSENRTGHINSTFFVGTSDGGKYVLQQINTAVFKDPRGLMDNIFAVTGYLRGKIAESGGDPSRGTLRFIKCRPDGNGNADKFYTDPEGHAWRVYEFIDDVVSLQSASSPEVFADVGRAFGNFQMMLSGFDASTLCETIPNFHNTPSRYADFEAALAADTAGRASGIPLEIDFVRNRKEVCSFITDRIARGELPLRVTHNDTKLNNLLLDKKTLKPVCVIDLDTVMPGSVLFDFGDAIRFGASTAAEDETNLSKVGTDLRLFRAFTEGFCDGLGGSLTENELRCLPMGALVITLETGIRFLGDYLAGDVYFRISHPEHNLERARNQFAIVADMEKKMDLMNAAVDEIIRKKN